MVYNALTVFLPDELQRPTILEQACRLVHFDFTKAGIYLKNAEDEDRAAELIAQLIEQEIERAKRVPE